MTQRPIGYYVHHHGAGHRTRAAAIAAACDRPIVLLGTGMGEAGLDLPDDRPLSGRFDGLDEAPHRPDALHYAPVDHEGIRARVARIVEWIARERPALMVVDVSVEVAMLARLASVPTVCVRLNGERDDPAHLDAFRGATGLLAPFHEALEAPSTPDWVREKTRYFPGLTAAPAIDAPVDHRILVVFGKGGAPGDGTLLAAAARACPQWQWRVIGPAFACADIPDNLVFAGWVDSPAREIGRATLVIGAAGIGLVSAVLAADRPFVCIPESRPFAEQVTTASGLKVYGAAIVEHAWPDAEAWPAIIQEALALPVAARRALHDPQGARKAAAWIASLADAASISWEDAA
ncbi:hypothetical protein WSK_1530 [Novosphingobium sp. Rr 2-17]|uniref:glycosyl transferase n=1 Tax=Novosphingobium sp. Rr 2-17 TaxID=555793 RepID=UPI0002699501|nr:glycosyl transferase [Novosphingobium sp. Rr 2-17]EIZ79854.1 hypothetical protein WSK_1530 [Novosphingobium sp. Rr 2-17]